APRAHPTHPSPGHRSDRPYMELSGVYLAASAHRSSPHQADGRTDCTSADPSAPGPTYWKDTSTYAYRDASRERARGSPATESCVRYPLLFSRTTVYPNTDYITTFITLSARPLPPHWRGSDHAGIGDGQTPVGRLRCSGHTL